MRYDPHNGSPVGSGSPGYWSCDDGKPLDLYSDGGVPFECTEAGRREAEAAEACRCPNVGTKPPEETCDDCGRHAEIGGE